MFRLIDRYVFKELLGGSLLGLFAYTAIFVVNTIFKLADSWVRGQMTLGDLGLSLVYYVPSILVLTIPSSVLLGVLLGFSRMSSESEITALRTTGISYFRLLKPTLLLAVVAWGLTEWVYLDVVPASNTRAGEIMQAAIRHADPNREIRPGTWTPLSDGGSGQDVAILARDVDESDPKQTWLKRVDIIVMDRQAGEARHYQADRAHIERVVTGEDTGRPHFFFEGLRTIVWNPDAKGEPPKISEATSGDHVLGERRMVGIGSGGAGVKRSEKSLRTMTLRELAGSLRDYDTMDRIDRLKKTDPKGAARLQAQMTRVPLVPVVRDRMRILAKLEIHKKFAIPVACLVFALTGMPLGISTRRGGRSASFAISIAVVVVWWLIFNWGSTWATAHRLSPAAGAWLPDLAIGVVAVHSLVVQRRQQAVGLYRALRDGVLLGALVLLMLTAVFLWEIHALSRAGDAPPSLPLWAPIGGVVLLALHVAFVVLRDPLSKALADLSEAFRRPRAQVPEEPEALLGTEGPPIAERLQPRPREHAFPTFSREDAKDEAEAGERRRAEGSDATRPLRTLDEAERRRWQRRARLEKVRGALVFAFLALCVVCVVEAFQNDDGPVAGAQALLTSWEPVALVLLGAGCVALQLAGVRVVSTLDWWIFGGLVRWLTVVLASIVIVYLVMSYLEIADTILQNKVPGSVAIQYFVHLLPRIITEVLPFAAMGAVVVVFGIMTKFNETTAVRCGGVSVWRVVLPAVLLGVLLSCGAFVIHDYVLPRSNQTAEDLRRQMQNQQPLQRTPSARGFLLASDGRTLYQYRSVIVRDAPGILQAQITGLTILVPGSDEHIHDLWSATDAEWRKDHWVLRAGWHAAIDSSNQVKVDTFDEQPLPSLDPPDYFSALRKSPDQMAFSEFSRYVEEQSAAGFPTAPLRVELQEKLASPAAALVLILIGLPFAFTMGKRGALTGVGVGLILAVLYLAMVAFFRAMGSAEYLPAIAAAWAPNAIFGFAGLYFLLHVRT